MHTGVKSTALVGAVFIDFSQNKCANCSRDPILHRAAPYDELFSWGTRHHCSIEIGACSIQLLINPSLQRIISKTKLIKTKTDVNVFIA